MHCSERGELLDRVRRWYELEIKRVNNLLEHSKERERRLKGMVRTHKSITVAELDASFAMKSQRLELLQMVAHKVGCRGMGTLIGAVMRELPERERHEMLAEMLPHVKPLPRSMASEIALSTAAASADAQLDLMQHLHDSIEEKQREKLLVNLFAMSEGGLDEAADSLTDVLRTAVMEKGGMHGIDGASKSKRLISKLVTTMSDSSRGAAIAAILDDLDAERQASVIGDALLESDHLSRVPMMLKELIEGLSDEHRASLIPPLLNDIATQEREALLSQILYIRQNRPC